MEMVTITRERYDFHIAEIERLRQQNAELVEALENAANGYRDRGHEGLEDMCRAAIAKATGGE